MFTGKDAFLLLTDKNNRLGNMIVLEHTPPFCPRPAGELAIPFTAIMTPQ